MDSQQFPDVHVAWLLCRDEIAELVESKMLNTAERFVLRSASGGQYMTQAGAAKFRDIYPAKAVSPLLTSESGYCRYVAFDIDDHKDGSSPTLAGSIQICRWLAGSGFHPLLEESSPNSFHIWVKFDEPISQLSAFRLVDHVRSQVFSTDCDFETFPKNDRSQSYLRLPGFRPDLRRYSKFAVNRGTAWSSDPQVFINWLLLPGDDPATLVPEILSQLSEAEHRQWFDEHELQRTREKSERKRLYQQATGKADFADAWRQSRETFEAGTEWAEVLDGRLIEVKTDLWARNAGDNHCASTSTGRLKVFGKNTRDDLGLEDKTYSKWDLFEHFNGTKGDSAAAKEALKQRGAWIAPAKTERAAPQPSEQRIRIDPPPKKPRPKLVVDDSISREDYAAEVVRLMVDNAEKHREPFVIESGISHIETLIKFLSTATVRTIITVTSIEAAATLAEELTKTFFSGSVDFWDHRRLEDDKRSELLLQNCENPVSATAAGMGFNASAAVCRTCDLKRSCRLENRKKHARLADHLIVTSGTLGFLGPETFANRDLIIAIGSEPHEILSTTSRTTNTAGLIDILEQAGQKLLESSEFNRGEVHGFMPSDDRAGKNAEWHEMFFGRFLPSIKAMKNRDEQLYCRAGEPPAYATSHLFHALQTVGFTPGDGESLTPILRAAEHHNAATYHDQAFEFSAEHATHNVPVMAMVTKAVSDDFDILRPSAPLRDPTEAIQHVLPLSKASTPERFCRALRAVLSDYMATKAIVVCPRDVRTQIEELIEDSRVSRIVSYHAATVDSLKDADLIVCLGSPPVSSEVMKRSLMARFTRMMLPTDSAAINRAMEFGPQLVGLETSIGGLDDVMLQAYPHPEAMEIQGNLIQQKMGQILAPGTPPVVLVCSQYSGLKLAPFSLVPETEIVSGIRLVMAASSGPMTGGMIRQKLKVSGIALDRRRFGENIEKLISRKSCLVGVPDGVSGITRFRTGRPVHLQYKESIVGVPDGVSGIINVWFRAAEFAIALNVTDRTARRRLNTMVSNEFAIANKGRGKNVRYRLTEAGTAALSGESKPIEFETDSGQAITAIPPAEWNGSEPLYCRGDLLTLKQVDIDVAEFQRRITAKVERDNAGRGLHALT